MSKGMIVLIILGMMCLAGLAMGPNKEMQKKYPRNGLTDEQMVTVVDHCIQHPDALDCHH